MRDPNVPESLEGWWILHRMFGFRRRAWDDHTEKRRSKIVKSTVDLFDHLRSGDDGDVALAQLIGHKGDLMITHYARTFDGLAYAQTLVDKLELREFLDAQGSYVSVLELGMYDATVKIHAELAERGLNPQSPEWIRGFDELIEQQAANPYVAPRLWAKIPRRRYAAFYPTSKRRGERHNWYALPYEERAKLMNEHGKIARSYRGQVAQVISGSIGYDDFEWGVDLYGDDPVVFKKLLTEMRFEAAGSIYNQYGPFWSGLQFSPSQIPAFLDGDAVPQLILSKKEEAADATVS